MCAAAGFKRVTLANHSVLDPSTDVALAKQIFFLLSELSSTNPKSKSGGTGLPSTPNDSYAKHVRSQLCGAPDFGIPS